MYILNNYTTKSSQKYDKNKNIQKEKTLYIVYKKLQELSFLGTGSPDENYNLPLIAFTEP